MSSQDPTVESLDRSRLLEAVFNQRSQFMAVLAINGTILDVNDRYFQVLNVPREAVLGRKFWETPLWNLPPQMQALWKTQIDSAIATGKPISGEGEYSFADGTLRNISYTLTPLRNHIGRITNLLIEGEDITDREQQETVKQQLSELETIYDTAAIGLCFQDRDLRYLRVNDRLAEMNGVSVADHLGRTLREVLPAIADRLEPLFFHVLQTGEPIIDLEIRAATPAMPDFERDWLASYVPVKDAIGTTLGVSAIIQELTQLKQAEARLEAVLYSTNDAVIVLNSDWRCTYANDRALELSQRSKEVLFSRSIWELYPETIGTLAYANFQQAMTEQIPIQFEYFYPSFNCWFDFKLYPSAIGLSIFYADITDRKRAEADRDRFFSLSLDLLAIAKFDGYFLRLNPAWEQVLGWTEAELCEQPYLNFVHPDDRDGTITASDEVIRDGTVAQFENRYRCKDGSYRWLLWTTSAFTAEQRMYAIAHDITDRKQAELEREALLAREQAAREAAEQANRVKDDFLAVLSHELRTPLNPILGWSKILQRHGTEDPMLQRGLETIERNVKLQTQLIDDLLDVSRILRGTFTLDRAAVSLVPVIAAAIETVRLAADAKSIQIQTEIDPNVGLILGDARRLQQVVWNLLSNAVKFTPNQGQVTVQLAQIKSMTQLQVSDTGRGINADFLPFVFESFRQEDGTVTRKYGGLGLGLAIVRQIVELHGGTVSAFSLGLNQGATFTVRFPILERA